MTLPPGLRVECWPQAVGWGVRLYWAGNKRARIDGLVVLGAINERDVRSAVACTLYEGLWGMSDPTDQKGTLAERKARIMRRVQRFALKCPLEGVQIEQSGAVVTITCPSWTPARARAVSAVLAERGIGIEIRAVGHAPRYVSVIHGLPRAVEWPPDVVSKSFIATSVPPVSQVVTLATEAVA